MNTEEAAVSKFLKGKSKEEKNETHSANETTAEPGNTEKPCSIQKATPAKNVNLPPNPNSPPVKQAVPTTNLTVKEEPSLLNPSIPAFKLSPASYQVKHPKQQQVHILLDQILSVLVLRSSSAVSKGKQS